MPGKLITPGGGGLAGDLPPGMCPHPSFVPLEMRMLETKLGTIIATTRAKCMGCSLELNITPTVKPEQMPEEAKNE